jgi:cell division protein FtsB
MQVTIEELLAKIGALTVQKDRLSMEVEQLRATIKDLQPEEPGSEPAPKPDTKAKKASGKPG